MSGERRTRKRQAAAALSIGRSSGWRCAGCWTAGSYTRDMVHNDPFLRGSRMTMVYDGPEKTAALMAQRFPAYTRRAQEKWGEWWTE